MFNNQKSHRIAIAITFVLLLLSGLAFLTRSAKGPTAKLTPSFPFDYVKLKAEALEMDRDRIVSFVRDDVALQQYEGCLRGATGTLWAGAGNEVDQSILLAELLRASGFTTRYATDGESWWIQMQEKESWSDVSPTSKTELAANWTGRELPQDVFHTLEVNVVVENNETGAKVAKKTWNAAALVHHPLELTFSDCKFRISPRGKSEELAGDRELSSDETMTLVFRHRPPGETEPTFTVRREIYTGRYLNEQTYAYAKDDDSRNVHVIAVAPGKLSRWAYDKEIEIAKAKVDSSSHEILNTTYALALSHLVESDEELGRLVEHFQTVAFIAEPRLIISSTLFDGGNKEIASRALDLRRNVVHVPAGDEAKARLSVTRAILENELEGRVLESLCGGSTESAMALFLDHIERRRESTTSRVDTFQNVLTQFAKHCRTGAKIKIGSNDADWLSFTRNDNGALTPSLSASLSQWMDRRDERTADWQLERNQSISADQFANLATEIELLLGVQPGTQHDYQPQIELTESTNHIVRGDVKIVWYDSVEQGKPAILTYEEEFLGASDAESVQYNVIDHWDHQTHRAISPPSTGNYALDSKIVSTGNCFGLMNDYQRVKKMNPYGFSRNIYLELKESGEALVDFLKDDNTMVQLKLFLCKSGSLDVLINNRPSKVPALWVAGGLAEANAGKTEWDKVDVIYDGTYNINKWIILDDPLFPMRVSQKTRFQTSLPGRIVSKATQLGIAGATITVEGTDASATTWSNGQFILPLIRKPFDKFIVTVTCDGYMPHRNEFDFRELATVEELQNGIELEPVPTVETMLWVRQDSKEQDLQQIENPRIRQLIDDALTDDAGLVALVPRSEVPSGLSVAHSWVLFDSANMSLTLVADDGLHGASGNRRSRKQPKQPGGRGPGGGVASYAGFISGWYVYSAGRLDALSEVIEGEPIVNVGHEHAMEFAEAFVEYSPSLEYELGFRAALAYFDSHPEFRGD